MRRTSMMLALIVVLVGALAGAAYAGDLAMRSFDRFTFDTATARGLWAELQVAYAHENDALVGRRNDIDVVTVAPVIAFGNQNWEGGAIIPYQHVDGRVCSLFSCGDVEEDGIGDIQLYGKYVFRSRYVHVGAGIDFSLPSGDDKKGLGAGELGIAPFATAALVLGPVEVRTHMGKLFYTNSRSTALGEFPADALLWGVGLFWPMNDIAGVRVEAVGTKLDSDFDENAVSFEPGIDIRIPAGAVDMMLRLTGAVGLTDLAPDWGVGCALAILFEP